MTDVVDNNYRAVVALNNIGVTLLQRRCDSDAIRTFKDALDLMSCIRDDIRRPMIEEKRCIFVEKAYKRIARSTKVKGGDSTVTTARCPEFVLSVLSQHENNASAILSAIPNIHCGFAHRLELDESNLDHVTDTAMILHNFSVAIRMKSKSTEKKCCRRMVERSYMVAQVAGNILFHQFEALERCQIEKNENYLQVTLTVVQDLVLLCSIQKEIVEARKYYGKLGLISSMLTEIQDFTLARIQKVNVGAKAA
jgi:hypothetical protein